MTRTYRYNRETGKMEEVTGRGNPSLTPTYLGDRTLVRQMAARGQIPIEEFPRLNADRIEQRKRDAQREKGRRARQIAEVVTGKGYRFT